MGHLVKRESGDTMDCLEQEVPLETKDHSGLLDQQVYTDMMERMDLRVRLAYLAILEILVYQERGVPKVRGDLLAILAHQVQRAALERLENEV